MATTEGKARQLRLIIFDFDGTLGDTRRNIVTTMQDVMREIGVSYVPEPESESQTPDIDPDINLSDPVSVPEGMPVDATPEISSDIISRIFIFCLIFPFEKYLS